MRSSTIISTLVLAVCMAAPLPAQGRAVGEGDAVRLRLEGGGRHQGRVTQATDSVITLALTGPASGAVMDVPLARVTRLEVATGRRNLGRGAGVGALIGGGVGIALGLAAGETDCTGKIVCVSPAESAAILGLGGAAVGGLLGLLAAPPEYRVVSLSHVRVGVSPIPNGRLGLTVAARF